MKRLMFAIGLLPALALAGSAWAQTQQTPIQFFGSPFDSSNQIGNLNTLIQRVNAILTPLQPTIAGAVNFVSLTSAPTGLGPVIGVQPGGDTNASIRVSPAGNGDISLFSSKLNLSSTGHIKIGNMASWVKAPALATCPGSKPGQPRFGVANTITGYLVIKDWLDQTHGMPGC